MSASALGGLAALMLLAALAALPGPEWSTSAGRLEPSRQDVPREPVATRAAAGVAKVVRDLVGGSTVLAATRLALDHRPTDDDARLRSPDSRDAAPPARRVRPERMNIPPPLG